MRAWLVRVLLLLSCLAMVVPVCGPEPTMAKESEQETGIIQCTSFSRDTMVELTFPAAGGPVQGSYLSQYTAHDTSPLYDEDGSWDYYDEDRTVTTNTEFSGTYSGGENGVFSGFQVAGTAAVDIDNLFDDRFDRSYRAVLNTPGTATRGPGGSVNISGVTGEFTLTSVNASEIPNTEWLSPPSGVFPHDITLVCTPQPRVQTPQDISCFITTDPPELGARDTSFQASVTATGFGPGATLDAAWILRQGVTNKFDVMAAGLSPTITWSYTMFADGYYGLFAGVTDGGHEAWCSKHFSIGDVEPNNPPECLDVSIVPLSPRPGIRSLGAIAAARDADGDPLEYVFNLGRGGQTVGPSGPVSPLDSYVFSIPGGLQPGPYTVMVEVGDGKQQEVCTFHFVVPDFVGGESAACGPVGIMYLDDYDVEMNALAIDAAIEAALAEGGPEYSLIVSHRQRLIDQFGQQGFEQIDALLNNMRSVAETCPFLLIVGDWDIVPPGVLPNPAQDGDPLVTDDVYGDTDHDSLTVIDIPVARIPDGDSLDLLLTQLSPSEMPEGGNFIVANAKRPHADVASSRAFGTDRVLIWSLPTHHDDIAPDSVNVRHDYLVLHGSAEIASAWWGEEPTLPVAFTVNEAHTRGVVLSAACYGALTYGHTPEDSIALAFLANGSRAFVGSTVMTYAFVNVSDPEDLIRWTGGRFEYTYLNSLAAGEAPLEAFISAKQEMGDWSAGPRAQPFDIKTLHEMHYYGRP